MRVYVLKFESFSGDRGMSEVFLVWFLAFFVFCRGYFGFRVFSLVSIIGIFYFYLSFFVFVLVFFIRCVLEIFLFVFIESCLIIFS